MSCTAEPEDTVPEPSIVVPPEEAEHTVTTLPGGTDAAAVELRFYNISDLHRGFFADPRFSSKLGTELGVCVTGTAQVVISYDSDKWLGRMVLKIPPDQLRAECLPKVTGSTVDLTPLQPVGVALANYRDVVSANTDFRLASFRVGTSFTRGANQCVLQIAGQYPPDGRRWSPCVAFAGIDRCGAGDKIKGVTTLEFTEQRDAAALSACFSR